MLQNREGAGKSKVMVGRNGGKIVNFGKWPCGVYGKGVHHIESGFISGFTVMVQPTKLILVTNY